MAQENQRNRRNFLAAAGASIVALLPARSSAARRERSSGVLAKASSALSTGNIYDELGVTTIINGMGTITLIGGSLMPAEVVAAMEAASKHYVSIPELLEATGGSIAKMLDGLPPDHTATVTSGAAGAIMCGVSGVLTGENQELIQRLPDLTGMKSEVIFQKAHHEVYDYSQQILASGVKIIEVEYPDDVRRAANQRTALLYFANYLNSAGHIKVDAWAKLAKELGVPCFNDCAADTPPIAHLTAYNKMGYDLVAWSGGKAIRGPQCAGMLIGRKDFVRAARLNAAPHDPTLGRGMKVGKEEIVGMWRAVQVYLREDSPTETDDWWNRLEYISKQLRKFQGVTTAFYVPPIANHVPTMRIEWDPRKFALTTDQAFEFLKNGKPSVLLQKQNDGVSLAMNSFMLRPGDDRIIASRLKQMFQAHRA
jgi:uncharacterized pyridoxal phosphate-dependent enzyme